MGAGPWGESAGSGRSRSQNSNELPRRSRSLGSAQGRDEGKVRAESWYLLGDEVKFLDHQRPTVVRLEDVFAWWDVWGGRNGLASWIKQNDGQFRSWVPVSVKLSCFIWLFCWNFSTTATPGILGIFTGITKSHSVQVSVKTREISTSNNPTSYQLPTSHSLHPFPSVTSFTHIASQKRRKKVSNRVRKI